MTGTYAPIGTAVVVFAEPHEGTARAYNRWYEDDHVYAAGMAGPGAMSHGRWVAPAGYKAMRRSTGLFGDPGRGSYLLAFWIHEGMQEDWDAWLASQEARLREADRWEFPKDHVYTGCYRFDWETHLDSGPRAIVALDADFAGVVAVAVVREPGADAGDVEAWARRMTSQRTPVWVGLSPLRLFKSVLSDPPAADPASFTLLLGFSAGDAAVAWRERIEPALPSLEGLASVREIGFGGPFRRTVVGTDAFVDEL